MNKMVSVRLDAHTPMGDVYFVEITDGELRSIVARVSDPCIAPEHGRAAEFAQVIAVALDKHISA